MILHTERQSIDASGVQPGAILHLSAQKEWMFIIALSRFSKTEHGIF